jgi:carboxyl-terminal processing protease
MRRRSPRVAMFFAMLVFTSGLFSGALTGRAAVARAQDPYARLDLLAKVFATIQREYVEEVTPDELVDAAIAGMTKVLDPHSRWLSEEQLAAVRTDTTGETTGLGIEVKRADEGLTIEAVLPDSPAALHGLQPGDRILTVDGRPVGDLPFDEVEDLFSGPRGETATLEVLRAGWESPRTLSAPMDVVKRTIVHGELLRGAGAPAIYVHLTQFQDGAADDVQAEIARRAEEAGGLSSVAGVVLDLRDNPGGLLDEAVGVVDLFLDDGVVVSTRGRPGEPDEVHRATPGGLPTDLALVVLVNGMSASASEIVASAIQETKRGTIVGERTYGKGSVQQVYVHSERHALKLTVGRYFTASGAPVADREGRTPDLVVAYPVTPTPKQALDRELRGVPGLQDADREHLLGLLAELPDGKPNRPEIPWDRSGAERLPDDPQLRAAVAALGG